jgi:vacuolar-type H+-ATPase subunit E/Vma4
LQEEPLAAEVEARVRQEAEREALKQVAAQVGEKLPEVDEEAELDDGAGDEALDDYDDGEVRLRPLYHSGHAHHDSRMQHTS